MKVEPIDRRALPPGARVTSWPGPDGWPLRLFDWPQPDPGRSRGTLLFAGGRGDFVEKYVEAIGHWHARGWDVVSFDWRGQGGSCGDIEGGHLDSFDPLVADGAAVIEHAFTGRRGARVAVAHSMGGHILLRILAERRPALDAAVLVAPMIGINAAPLPPLAARALAAALTRAGLARRPAWRDNARPAAGSPRQTFLTSCRERYEDEGWWHARSPRYRLGPPSWGWLAAAYRSIAALTPERLRKVETPILLLLAPGDRLVSPAAIRRAAGLLPRGELFVCEGAAHEILRERDEIREAALDRIDAFLDARAPAQVVAPS